MAMTNKDYKLTADFIAEQLSYTAVYAPEGGKIIKDMLEDVANTLANLFEKENPAFNKEKFLQAAISRSAL